MIWKILGYVSKNSLWLRFDYQRHYLIFSHWAVETNYNLWNNSQVHICPKENKKRNEYSCEGRFWTCFIHQCSCMNWINNTDARISTTPAPKNYKLYSHHQQSIKYGKGLIYLFLSKEMVWLGSLISDIDKPLGMILTTKSVSA